MTRLYRDLSRFIRVAPRETLGVLEQLRSGDLHIHIHQHGIEKPLNRLTYGIMTSALLLGSSVMWAVGAKPTLFGVSGHVVRPGLFELPLGTPLAEIVFEHAGGVPDGRKVKAVIPGGLSMPALPAGQLDVRMANEFLRERRTMLGTGGIVVMDDTTCMVRAACVIAEFFRDESCGQCTQCREGTAWMHEIARRIERGEGGKGDLAILSDVAASMEGQTICAFADAAAWPVQALLRHFFDDFEAHVRLGRCPFDGSFAL